MPSSTLASTRTTRASRTLVETSSGFRCPSQPSSSAHIHASCHEAYNRVERRVQLAQKASKSVLCRLVSAGLVRVFCDARWLVVVAPIPVLSMMPRPQLRDAQNECEGGGPVELRGGLPIRCFVFRSFSSFLLHRAFVRWASWLSLSALSAVWLPRCTSLAGCGLFSRRLDMWFCSTAWGAIWQSSMCPSSAARS
jgi:hypothetical protein